MLWDKRGGQGIKELFFFFRFFLCGWFSAFGGEGGMGGGLAHSEKTHCRAFGSLFDRVAWETEQWIELIRFTIFAQRRKEGGRNSEHSGCPSPPQLCKGDSDARFSCKLPSAGNRVIYCICRAAPTSRYYSGGPFIFTITTYVIGPFSYHGSCL